ncbi:hypothetical protein V5O48_012428, partial [Marasmius crinis-equi]
IHRIRHCCRPRPSVQLWLKLAKFTGHFPPPQSRSYQKCHDFQREYRTQLSSQPSYCTRIHRERHI